MDAPTLPQLLQQAMTLHKAGRMAEAEPLYEAALREQPGAYPVLHLMGLLRQQQGRNDEALALMERALAAQPGAPETLVNYGLALSSAGRLDEALAALDQAVAARPDSEGAWNNLGLVQAKLRRYEDALSSFLKATSLAPGFAEAHFNTALAFLQLRCGDDALASLGRATALNPGHAFAHALRGRILAEGGQNEKARDSFDKALALDPRLVNALSGRGKLLCNMGQTEAGLADLARAASVAQPVRDADQKAYLAGGAARGNGARLPVAAVNAAGPQDQAAQAWATDPQLLVVDSLLSGEAIEALRLYSLTVPAFQGGIARLEDGLASALLAQIESELRATHTAVFAGHTLRDGWLHLSPNSDEPSDIEAGDAAVTVQVWLTPDEANADPEHGGLLAWNMPAPAELARRGDDAAARVMLATAGAASITVPYRFNRALFFGETLLFQTDRTTFRPGFDNRRLTLTLQFGRRAQP